ncbi:Uu.00g086120.m01.CDS01 [Anthostomella pinea]|uniref:Uu.00g086120.m01.CDS01 n=1 Tax=Anthostomella pinea TaxID=933095 RepID=A0AAI8YJR3_9PEZI|nr:Uu.00g086120.m01.CDS01 [Anthostomella pinea]
MANPYFNPDYNPYTQSVLIGTAILFMIVPICAVGLRFYSRSISWAKLGIDDWFTIPSMIICVALSIVQLIATTVGGLGAHQPLVNGELVHSQQLYVYEKTRYAYEIVGTIGLCVIKLSVLLFYRRIFAIRAARLVNNVFIGLTAAWGISFTFAVAFQCTPVSTLWEKFEYEYEPYCVQVFPLYFGHAISDLILDVFIFILPIPHLWSLKMPQRQKLAVGGIFLLGAIVVAIGITRTLIFHWVIDFATVQPMSWFYDTTWYSAGVLFWHIAENVVGLLGCCLPSYAPLFKNILHKQKTLGASSGASSSGLGASKKRGYPSPYHERLEDEESLTRIRAAADGGSEEHALGIVPERRILVNREFRLETSAA